jgi:hypothetical protein
MRRRIMLVDPAATSKVYEDFMKAHLGVDFDICVCKRGNDCIKDLYHFNPDFIYINMMLEDMDPLMLIHDIHALKGKTAIIIGANPEDTYYIRQLESLNIHCALIAPYSLEEVGRQLCELATFAYPTSDAYTTEFMDYILLRLGIKCCVPKYESIVLAVKLKLQNPNIAAMKELYPALADKVNGTTTSVEKGIRDAIRIAREEEGNTLWKQFFPNLKDGENLHNEEFINRLALALKHYERPRISMQEFLSKRSATF